MDVGLLGDKKFDPEQLAGKVDRLTTEHLDYFAIVPLITEMYGFRQPDKNIAAWALATNILWFFLGKEWVDKHVFANPSSRGQVRKDRRFLKSDLMKDDPALQDRHTIRVVMLAECLFNLQDTPGITERIRLIKKQCGLEGALAELECARVMSDPELQFRFVDQEKHGGKVPDCEITTTTGRTLYCEIKAKEEETVMSSKSVSNALEAARKQLPKNSPGVILLRLPGSWNAETRDVAEACMAAINKAFENSEKIVSVVVVAEKTQEAPASNPLVRSWYSYGILGIGNIGSPHFGDDIAPTIDKFGLSAKWLELGKFIESRFRMWIQVAESCLALVVGLGLHPSPPTSPDSPL